jgi:hypothetical protein
VHISFVIPNQTKLSKEQQMKVKPCLGTDAYLIPDSVKVDFDSESETED